MATKHNVPAVHSLNDSACHHSICAQQPQLLDSNQQQAALQTITVQHVLVIAVLAYPPVTEPTEVRLFESPPLRAPLLVSLQSILRV